MATTRTFNDMLNDYLTYDLLKEELIKRDYLLSKIEKDNGWKGGSLPVPFKAAGASTVTFGSLAASNDVAEDKYVRGEVSAPKEVWGTMIFNQRDLLEHDGKVNEKSFLKLLPDAIEDFMDHMKNTVSTNLMNGAHFATLTSDATANDGLMVVDRPERFNIGEKVIIDDGDSTAITAYVSTIDINTSTILVVTARGGATPVDFSANTMTIAQSAKVYHDGAQSASFTSLRDQLLSDANGGSATLFGQTKTAYPFLQAVNVDGTAITAANILSSIFDAYTTARKIGKGNPNEIVMSYKNLGSVLKALETSKGAFNVEPGSQKTSVYGWTEINIGGVKGSLKVIGVQEMDDDIIFGLDWRGLKFHSNGFFKKRTAPDGKQYHEVRATTGYQYLVDIMLFGELIVNKPSYQFVIHTVAY